ncbi:MAG: cobalamin B12-binding domain-containing protein, partial [Saprospiraceae bacterium]|nr:cobalamin B12-binding domain-containing protein [Saprospiraceae bacterium]
MSAQINAPYKPQNHIRIVTAASLFDGHDAAINIMRRVMQASGAEIIHLGHNRSVAEVVDCAIQEDAQAIAMTSYQGGHVEYLKYMYDLLKEKGAGHIKIFGGGGGTILPSEIEELHAHGITRIYHPDDGRAMGLQGMINDVLQRCDFSTYRKKGVQVPVMPDGEEEEQQPVFDDLQALAKALPHKNPLHIGRLISVAENYPEEYLIVKQEILQRKEAHNGPH